MRSQSSSYIDFPIITDIEQIKQDIYDAIAEQFPGWQPDHENAVETWLIEGFAALIYDLKILAVDVPPEIFKLFGQQIVGISPGQAVSASAKATILAVDNQGYTLRAGDQIGFRKAGDELIAFEVVYDVTIEPGKEASEAGQAILRAVIPGVDGNDLTGPFEAISSTIGWVDDVVLEEPTSGGEDDEDPREFLNKLHEKMQQLSPKLIVARDFEIEARNTEGIAAALAEDNYRADTKEENVGNCVTMWLRDESGLPVSAEAKERLSEAIERGRTQNFIFFLEDADYNEVDNKIKVRCLAGHDPAQVKASVEEAIHNYEDPDKYALLGGDTSSWVNRPILRYKELVTVIENTLGVDYIEELKVALKGKAKEEKDVALTGRVPLTKVAELAVTAEPAV